MLTAERLYCSSRFAYQRRRTREVQIGTVAVGGAQPIRVQSMTTTRTQDVEATLSQSIRLIEAGCEIVRITAPTVADAQASETISAAEPVAPEPVAVEETPA